VIYFFSRGQQYARCEVLPGVPHVLRVVDADGTEHTERCYSAVQLEDRWTQVCSELLRDGWEGPFGRDGRS
jgi:hypothetical protein